MSDLRSREEEAYWVETLFAVEAGITPRFKLKPSEAPTAVRAMARPPMPDFYPDREAIAKYVYEGYLKPPELPPGVTQTETLEVIQDPLKW